MWLRGSWWLFLSLNFRTVAVGPIISGKNSFSVPESKFPWPEIAIHNRRRQDAGWIDPTTVWHALRTNWTSFETIHDGTFFAASLFSAVTMVLSTVTTWNSAVTRRERCGWPGTYATLSMTGSMWDSTLLKDCRKFKRSTKCQSGRKAHAHSPKRNSCTLCWSMEFPGSG